MLSTANEKARTCVEEAKSEDAWAEIVARTVFPLAHSASGPQFVGKLRYLDLPGGVRICDVSTDPVRLERTRRLLSTTPSDDLLLLFHLQGGLSGAGYGDQSVRLSPGAATLLDPSREYWVESKSHARQAMVVIPRADVDIAPRQIHNLHARGIPAGSTTARALTSLIIATLRGPDPVDPYEAGAIASAISGLGRSVLWHGMGEGAQVAGQESLLMQARAYIRANLGDAELTPTSVAKALSISSRLLSRVMQGEDSPGAFIRREKLRAAHEELRDPRFEHLSCSEMGARWGFADPTTFSRAFSREFGIRPSDLKHSARESRHA